MHRAMKWLSCSGTVLALLLAALVAAQEFEKAPIFGPEDVLPQELLIGPGYELREGVENDGFSNIFFVETPDGTFKLESRDLLMIRIHEFRALEALKEVSGTKEYATAVGEAAKGPFVFAKDMITSPIQTTGGVFSGIGSYFSNIGHSIFGSPSEEEEGVVKRILGFDATKRGYAQEFEVDPYSTNEPLQDRMKDLSWASFAGGMTTAVATSFIPGTAGLVVAATSFSNDMNQLVYDNNPPKLKSINREKLEAMEKAEALRGEAEATKAAAAPPPPVPKTGAITSGTGFNPQISVILDGNYYYDRAGGAGLEIVENALQASQGAGEDHEHGGDGNANGFNLRETELVFSTTVDPYFDASAYLAVDESGDVELEDLAAMLGVYGTNCP